MFAVLFIYLLLRLTIAVDKLNWQSNWYAHERSVLAFTYASSVSVSEERSAISREIEPDKNICVGVGFCIKCMQTDFDVTSVASRIFP